MCDMPPSLQNPKRGDGAPYLLCADLNIWQAYKEKKGMISITFGIVFGEKEVGSGKGGPQRFEKLCFFVWDRWQIPDGLLYCGFFF